MPTLIINKIPFVIHKPAMANFTSVEELLDFCWCRDLQWPQVKNMAQLAGLDLSDDQFFQGYSDRQAKMEAVMPPIPEGTLLSEHW